MPAPEQWAIDVGESLLDQDNLLNEPAPLGLSADWTYGPVTATWTSTTTGVILNDEDLWTTWGKAYFTTVTSSTTSNLVWDNWNAWTATTGTAFAQPRSYTEREVGWRELQAQQDARLAEQDRVNSAAIAQASNLLAMVLDSQQLRDLQARRHFDLVGASGQLWRLYRGTSGNVKAIGADGLEIMAICAHPALWDDEHYGHLPTEDVLAAQALHLMHDDREFLRKANVHRGSRYSLDLVPALHNTDRAA